LELSFIYISPIVNLVIFPDVKIKASITYKLFSDLT